jgi:2'-5' RNA ligase
VSAAGTTYHLWLKPSGAAYDVLAEAIGELARELGAPVFVPHVTLLGHLEGSESEHQRRIAALGRELRPFPIVLTEASYSDAYFQCLFLRVQKSPAVEEAHACARRMFGQPDRGYMPHLSLVYGVYPTDQKRAIIARLRPELRTSFDASTVYLIKAESEDPKDWHEIAKVPFVA